jgi:hypothetical protein
MTQLDKNVGQTETRAGAPAPPGYVSTPREPTRRIGRDDPDGTAESWYAREGCKPEEAGSHPQDREKQMKP